MSEQIVVSNFLLFCFLSLGTSQQADTSESDPADFFSRPPEEDEETTTTSSRFETELLLPGSRHRQNPFLSILTPKDESRGSPSEQLQQDPLLQQLNPQPDLTHGLNVPRLRQDPLLRQLNPQADDAAAATSGLRVPHQRQDPLLRQLNPQADTAAAVSGLSVPRQRQDPLLRPLSPQTDDAANGSGGLSVPRYRQDPLLRGLTSGHQEASLPLDLPQVTTRKVNKDDDNAELSSLSPAVNSRKKDPLLRVKPVTASSGDGDEGLEPPPDFTAIFGTMEQRVASAGAAEKLRLSADSGRVGGRTANTLHQDDFKE